MDKYIFVNRIIKDSEAYKHYLKNSDELFIDDSTFTENVGMSINKFKADIEKGFCDYVLFIVYNNSSYIGFEDFTVVSIKICKLGYENGNIIKKLVFETANEYYIEYLLFIRTLLMDDKSARDYYDIILNKEILKRIYNFIKNYGINNNVSADYSKCIISSDSCISDMYKICFSKSYKRLQDKAQVFTSSKGDHYRNRLIHTNEVITISKILTDKINQSLIENSRHIDVDVVIAIAMGHDIGHTPFGHQGERTLNDIIELNEFSFIKNASKTLRDDMGGFKHNIQSVRVLSMLESNGAEYVDLCINEEVLEGILKHTKYDENDTKKLIPIKYFGIISKINAMDYKGKGGFNLKGDSYRGRETVYNIDDLPLYATKNFANIYANKYITGEIVAFADEIAQRCSDIEDAIRAKTVSINEFVECMKDIGYSKIIENIDLHYCSESDNVKLLCNNIVNYYTNELAESYKETNYKHIYLHKEIYNFNRVMSKYVLNKLIASNEIARFDDMSNKIIMKLFQHYYDNPRLLPKRNVYRIFYRMLNNHFLIDNAINFSEMGKGFVDEIIVKYKSLSCDDIIIIDYFTKCKEEDEIISLIKDINNNCCSDKLNEVFNKEAVFKKIKMDDKEKDMINKVFDNNKSIVLNNIYLIDKLISYEQQKIIIREICDYIAGMTDTFALSEYNRVC